MPGFCFSGIFIIVSDNGDKKLIMSDSDNKIPNCDVPALWLEHKTALKGYIYKRVADEDLVNDILQEVLLKVYNFCLSKSGVRNVRSWLFH